MGSLFKRIHQWYEKQEDYKKADYTLNGSVFQPLKDADPPILDFIEKPPVSKQEVFEELEDIRKMVFFACINKASFVKLSYKWVSFVKKISKIDNNKHKFSIPMTLLESPEELQDLNAVRNWIKCIFF